MAVTVSSYSDRSSSWRWTRSGEVSGRAGRGAGSDGASCKEIGSRLVTRDPDITRMMDRLENRGLLTRGRAKEDRRVVAHVLTAEGLDLVNALDGPIEEVHRDAMRHMTKGNLKELVGLLEELRSGL